MSIKRAIKRAFNEHSKQYTARKVFMYKGVQDLAGEITLMVELTVRRKGKKKPKRSMYQKAICTGGTLVDITTDHTS